MNQYVIAVGISTATVACLLLIVWLDRTDHNRKP